VRRLHPSPQPCWETLSANSYPADFGHWGAFRVLLEFVLGQGAPVQCLHDYFLRPSFPLRPPGSREAWAKLYVVSSQCSASSATNKSPNFHESLPSEHCQIHWKCKSTCARGWLLSSRDTFALPDLTGNCPLVVFRILFFNENNITLGGKSQK
jgi:hypothetical protein